MKRLMNLGLGLVMMLAMFSCSAEPAEQLYGKWMNTGIKITAEDGSELDAQTAETADQVIASLLKEKQTFEFSKGDEFDTYTKSSANGNLQSGDFQAVELDGKITAVLYDNDNPESVTKMELDEISEDKFTTSFDMDGMHIVYTYEKQ